MGVVCKEKVKLSFFVDFGRAFVCDDTHISEENLGIMKLLNGVM